MLSPHFYNATTRKLLAVFGTLFNNMYVHKTDASGKVIDRIRVPLAYGPKQKFLARLDQQDDVSENVVAIKLPRMAFEITGYSPDPNTKINKYNRVVTDTNPLSPNKNTRRTYSPWRLTIDLHILSKSEDDVLQLMEQIVPYFQPDYNVSIKGLSDMEDIKDDVCVTLSSISPSEEYEGDFLSRRAITYTLSFELRARYYGPLIPQPVIMTAITNFREFTSEDIVFSVTHATDLDGNITTTCEP